MLKSASELSFLIVAFLFNQFQKTSFLKLVEKMFSFSTDFKKDGGSQFSRIFFMQEHIINVRNIVSVTFRFPYDTYPSRHYNAIASSIFIILPCNLFVNDDIKGCTAFVHVVLALVWVGALRVLHR